MNSDNSVPLPKVLVVDDDESLRLPLLLALRNDGYEVALAAHGASAIRLLPVFKPDIIVTDIFMPERDGFELLTEARRQNRNMPVVVMSGGGLLNAELLLKLASAWGQIYQLHKPFNVDTLIHLIRRIKQELDGQKNRVEQKEAQTTSPAAVPAFEGSESCHFLSRLLHQNWS